VTFGGEGGTVGCDVCGVDVELDGSGRARFVLRTPEGSAPVHLRLYGEHHVSNALATAAVARALGMSVTDTAEALSEAVAQSRWRMEVAERPDGVTVVNDAYNANPESMRAALRALRAMAGGRRTWAVLGEMRELGEQSAVEHEALGRAVVEHGVSRLVVVGEAARPVLTGASAARRTGETEHLFAPDAAAALEALRDGVRTGDVVLVKASRATGLEVVAERLLGTADADRPGERA
jgi:UDP-N-acetylmuramoyl-tripeptide--D-alanyl-D-alanine ligase